MSQQIQIPLKPGWVEEVDPSASQVRTFCRNPTRSGPLQMSWWSAADSGVITDNSLLPGIAATFGEEQFGCGEPLAVTAGNCRFGAYGNATFSAPPEHSYAEIWVLYNGEGFLLVTYMSAETPDPVELDEVREMVLQIVRPTAN
ncbi:MAG: hypothetical protein JSS02_31945 [Planctomycetes bacterium]|nr:hypothetical protein [Planctomycetota bacterium]